MKETHTDVFKIQWRGIEIELSYNPKWSRAETCDVAHLEIRSISPPKAPLPITETGYRSHFFYAEKSLSKAEIPQLVTDWLDKEGRSDKWKSFDAENRQMNLF